MADFAYDKTQTFKIPNERERTTREILSAVYSALLEKGYDPINQIVGYILSEDPTYITNHKNARALICRIDRDELMGSLVKNYLGIR
ncbi:MAG: IreB family regulatory phosphoprotein [Clostridia bacterium]|nr:IreB family regulatory phosphoprotein [Clostridia bacterium]MBR4071549.1 IreB family regulatory phosphoprotein [Clostridia bacterium]MBR6651445.1 IreB family regulatory phosphoprotein [Clostridia bacterium]